MIQDIRFISKVFLLIPVIICRVRVPVQQDLVRSTLGAQVPCSQDSQTQLVAFSHQVWQASAHMLPSHSQTVLYDYNIVSHFVREDVCAYECLSLGTKSFWCMLWLPFRLSFICYKNTVMFFSTQIQLSNIKKPYYFPHKASPQTLLGCQLPCRLVPEIC